MNQCFCRSFAAAIVMSAVGAPVAVNAESMSQLEDSLPTGEDTSEAFELSDDDLEPTSVEASAIAPSEPAFVAKFSKVESSKHLGVELLEFDSSETTSFEPPNTSSNQVAASPQAESPTSDQTDNQAELVRVIAHPLDTNHAATLYVSDIPVLTFVGQELETLAAKSAVDVDTDITDADVAVLDPAQRAITVANQIEQFYTAEGNPETILVRWDTDLEEYAINVADETLVLINETAILPDTTADFAEDALQATNRLRRLLGGAEPLTVIEGQPEPTEPEIVAAGSNSWDVTSVFTGQASWYGPGFHGRRTASGEVFNQEALTAAHRTLPFGTRVLVTNLSNNNQVIVRINDRGPFSQGRILDLSAAAAREIGMYSSGIGQIRLEVLSE